MNDDNYTIIQQGDTVQTYILEIMCDARQDVETLPTHWASGSSCLVIEDSSVWVLGIDKEWHELE